MEEIIKLIENGLLDEAMLLIEDNILSDNYNYHELTLMKIAVLFKQQKYDEIISISSEELGMPYVPKEYEDRYNEAFEYANQLKRMDTGFIRTALSDEEIEHVILNSDNKEEVLLLIHQLSDRNIRAFLDVISKYLEDESKHPVIKSMLLEILIEQDINKIITVKKNNNVYEFNPSVNDLILDTKQVVMIDSILYDALDKEPSLYKIATEILNTYLYTIYPDFENLDEVLIAACMHGLALMYQAQIIDFKELEYLYSVDGFIVETMMIKIEDTIKEV